MIHIQCLESNTSEKSLKSREDEAKVDFILIGIEGVGLQRRQVDFLSPGNR